MNDIKEDTLYQLKDGNIYFAKKVSDKEVSFYKVSAWSGGALSLKKFSDSVVQEIGQVELINR